MYDYEEYRKRIEWLDKYNMCHKCGKQKKAPGRQFCFDCLDNIADTSRRRYDPEKARDYQARRRELYQLHKSAGICVRCSKPATHGMYCMEHSIKEKRQSSERAKSEKQKRRERGLVPDYRKNNDLCRWCGKPIDFKHGQVCAECAAKLSEYSKRGDKSEWRGMNDLVFKKKTDGR